MSMTFSCAAQTVNIDDHIIARFDSDPGNSHVCTMTVWHEGGEASVATFDRNGMVTGVVLLPPPSQTSGASATSSSLSTHDSADKKGKPK